MELINTLVSVVIPTYNRAKYLKDAIASVLEQDYQHIELIVVDDGSTDNTKEIVHQFTENEHIKITYIYQSNQGAQAARNKGYELAKGEYLVFFDSDDLWKKEKLSKQILFLEAHPDYGMVYSNCDFIQNGENKDDFFTIEKPYSGEIFEQLILANFIPSQTPMLRKSVFEKSERFDESLSKLSGQDWDLWLNLSLITKIGYVDEILASYRLHESNMTGNPERRLKGQLTVVDKYYNKINFDKQLYSKAKKQIYLKFGDEYSYVRNLSSSLAMYIHSLRYGFELKTFYLMTTTIIKFAVFKIVYVFK